MHSIDVMHLTVACLSSESGDKFPRAVSEDAESRTNRQSNKKDNKRTNKQETGVTTIIEKKWDVARG